jgi:hypothetical protein
MSQLSIFDIEMRDYLDELKKSWVETIENDGGNCPCCERWGKVNVFKLTEALAASLMWMYKHRNEDDTVDVQNKAPRWILKAKTYPLLKHWGLIESVSPRSGIWEVTTKGKDFLFGFNKLPDRVFIYNNEVFSFGKKETDYRGCLGVKFSFEDMMSERFSWTKLTLEKEVNG